jgi:SsrA-binding protein
MPEEKTLCTNRKARHDYHVIEKMEVGISLLGTEIKALREGRGNLKDSYASVEHGELFVYNMHIGPYSQAARENHDPDRVKRLLAHKGEILKLQSKAELRGFTLVPLRVYLKGNIAKVELAVAKGKKLYDKREAIAKRDAERQMEKVLKEGGRRR